MDQYFGFYTWDEDGNKFDQNGNQVDDSGVIIKTAEEIAEEQAQQEGASQAQQGDSDASSGTEPASTPAPTTDRGSDIPDTPFTGESASPSPTLTAARKAAKAAAPATAAGTMGTGEALPSAPDRALLLQRLKPGILQRGIVQNS